MAILRQRMLKKSESEGYDVLHIESDIQTVLMDNEGNRLATFLKGRKNAVQLPNSANLDNPLDTGYYFWVDGYAPINAPVSVGAMMYNLNPDKTHCWKMVKPFGSTTVYHRLDNGIWRAENPPRVLPAANGYSAEIATTEDYGGAVVYERIVGFGYLPNNTTKSVPHGISGFQRCVSARLVDTATGGSSGMMAYNAGLKSVDVSTSNVTIATNTNLSTKAVHVILRYTRS